MLLDRFAEPIWKDNSLLCLYFTSYTCLNILLQIYTNVGYEDLQEPSPEVSGEPGNAEQRGWRAKVSPPDHPVSCYDFDVLIGERGFSC